MLNLIGLGLNKDGLSLESLEAVKESEKIYLENYTVDFPYSLEELEKKLSKKIIPSNREIVEQHLDEILKEAKSQNVSILVYGNPLMATTHVTILQEAKINHIETRIFHSASIFDAISETGLQPYKFGKTASMPNFEADSYIEILRENQGINAHTLILIDIGLQLDKAIEKLSQDSEKSKIQLNKILICSRLGNKDSRIYYDSPRELQPKKIKAPFCIIIPGKLHFVEEEFLENFKNA